MKITFEDKYGGVTSISESEYEDMEDALRLFQRVLLGAGYYLPQGATIELVEENNA